jgi:hypothetical protein
MNLMQHRLRQRRIRPTEINRKVELARRPITDTRHIRRVVVPIEAHIIARDRQRRQRVDLVVRPVDRFLVDGQRLDDVGACDVVGAGCADGIVRTTGEGHSRIGGAGPGQVLEGADYAEDLCGGVGGAEDDGIGAGGEAGVAAVGGARVVLRVGEGEDEKGQDEEQRGAHCGQEQEVEWTCQAKEGSSVLCDEAGFKSEVHPPEAADTASTSTLSSIFAPDDLPRKLLKAHSSALKARFILELIWPCRLDGISQTRRSQKPGQLQGTRSLTVWPEKSLFTPQCAILPR